MICPFCKKQVPDGTLFCPECGQNVSLKPTTDSTLSAYWTSADLQNETITHLKRESESKIATQVWHARRNFIVGCLLLTAILIAVVYFVILKPNQTYTEAMELLNSENYEEAIEIFSKLNGFRDSSEKIIECKYSLATKAYNSENYDQAVELFEELGDYKDSANLFLEAKYRKAMDYMISGQYALAEPLLVGLKDTQFAESFAFLENLKIVESDMYTGNEGDSIVAALGTRNGTTDAYGIEHSHGLEAWIARWNYQDEQSWAYSTFALPSKVNHLIGKCVLISCYNQENFDTTMEIYIDDVLVESHHLSPDELPFDIDIWFDSASQMKIYFYDNVAVSGGTSFGIVDAILIDEPEN